jgi:hypothetical protein
MAVRGMALFVLCGLLAPAANAVPVSPSSPDGVAAVAFAAENIAILMTTGDIYGLHRNAATGIWERCHRSDQGPLPVPLGEIRDWDPFSYGMRVLTSGLELWEYQPSGTWAKVANVLDCVGPVQTQPATMGGFKSLFR